MRYNTEYFNDKYYFFLKEGKDKITLYYSVADTLTESRKSDDKKEFKKEDKEKVQKYVGKVLKGKHKPTSKKIKSDLDELVDSDLSLSDSNIPILSQKQYSPFPKTTDQGIQTARSSNDPVRRGNRVYWGESEDEQDNVVSEVNYYEVFGWKESKDKNYEDTLKTLKDMGIDDPEERVKRAEEMGKDPKLEKKKVKGAFTRQRLSEKDTIEEIQRKEMIKMVEDILTKKNKDNSDVVKKDTNKGVSEFITKNLKAIKNLAEKEGININQLIKMLKYE